MSCPKGPDLCYVRGDTAPLVINFKRSGTGEDWTGWTAFTLTVNTEEAPADATNQQFQMDGAAVTPLPDADGGVEFTPQGIDESAQRTESEGYTPGEYFYDVQATNPGGNRTTILLGGNFEVLQDINKG